MRSFRMDGGRSPYDRATKLEEIGYSVMTMSPALFRQMNQTELLAA